MKDAIGCLIGAAAALACFVALFFGTAMVAGLWLQTVLVWCRTCG